MQLHTGLIESSNPSVQSLPHSWNNDRPRRHGAHSYTSIFNLSASQAAQPQALYIARIGNRYQIWINQRLAHSTGDLFEIHEDYAHKPVLVKLDPTQLRAGSNDLKVTVVGEQGRYGGLSSLVIGDYAEVQLQYERRHLFQTTASVAIVTICFALGILSIAFSYYARNRHFLIFGIGALAWAARTSYAVVEYLALDYRLTLVAYDLLYCISVACILLSITYLINFRKRWYVHLITYFVAISFGLIALYGLQISFARSVFLFSMMGLVFFTFGLYVVNAYRLPHKISWFLSVVLLVCTCFALYDQFVIYQTKNGYELFALSRYSFFLVTVALSSLLGKRLLRMNGLLIRSHQRTNQRLNETKQRLAIIHEQRMQAEKSEALARERWRMMQDMHDGLGSHLVNLQFAAQNPATEKSQLADMAAACMNELRETVNAMGQRYSNVSDMLADLRDRLELTLSAKQCALVWQVDRVDARADISPDDIAALQKMVLEVFTNIAKHSSASQVTLSAYLNANQTTHIQITENGAGYHVDRAQETPSAGLGLLGLKRRAEQHGIVLNLNHDGRQIGFELRPADL